jgi:hypothetical protein
MDEENGCSGRKVLERLTRGFPNEQVVLNMSQVRSVEELKVGRRYMEMVYFTHVAGGARYGEVVRVSEENSFRDGVLEGGIVLMNILKRKPVQTVVKNLADYGIVPYEVLGEKRWNPFWCLVPVEE